MLGRVFQGWTSTKQRLICQAQGQNTVTPVRFKPAPLNLSQALYHCAPYILDTSSCYNKLTIVLLLQSVTINYIIYIIVLLLQNVTMNYIIYIIVYK